MNCPRCKYDLTGLPSIHTCPECGFGYNANEEVIVIGRRKPNLFTSALNVANMVVVIVSGARLGVFAWKWWGMSFLLGMLVLFVFARMKASRDGSLMLVGQDGIRFDPPWKGMHSLTWDNVFRAERSIWNGSLLFYDRNDVNFLRCPISRHRDMKTFRRLAKEITERAAASRSRAEA